MLENVIALEQLRAELISGKIDIARKLDFFGTRQKRNLAHLRKVDAHRIVGRGTAFVGSKALEQLLFVLYVVLRRRHVDTLRLAFIPIVFHRVRFGKDVVRFGKGLAFALVVRIFFEQN